MSNVLHPIVARYSLFFTLVLFDSSRIARSKHPRDAVHEIVLQAQERFQDHHHDAKATHKKMRALIRNVSTASSSSCNTSSTLHSQQSQSSHSSSPTTLADSVSTLTCSYPHSISISPTSHICAIPKSRRCSKPSSCVITTYSCTSCPSSTSVMSKIQDADRYAIATAVETSTPHPINDADVEPVEAVVSPFHSSEALLCSAEYRGNPNNQIRAQHLLISPSSSDSIDRSPVSHHNSQPQSRTRNTRRSRTKPSKSVRLRYARVRSIATLLSITLTVILLSLMQYRRYHLRKLRGGNKHSHRRTCCASARYIYPNNNNNIASLSTCSLPSASPRNSQQYKKERLAHKNLSPGHQHPQPLLPLHTCTSSVTNTTTTTNTTPTSLPQSSLPQFHPLVPSPPNSSHSRRRHSYTMSTTFALESIADRRPLKQAKEDYISAWLSQQSLHDDIDYDQEPIWEEPHEDINQIQDMSAIQLDAIGPTQHHFQHQPVAYDHLYLQPLPHLPYFDLLHCDQGYDNRRSFSLANLDKTTYSMWQQQEYAEHSYYQHEQQQYYDQLHYHTIHGYPFQSQEYSSHHYPLHDQSASMYASPHCSVSQWTYAASSPKRTADELAWDRHYYYQRLQLEEDKRASRLRGQQLRHRRRQVLSRQPQPDSVARTGSLNRLASPSLLSAETSRVLGLCRSNTLTAAVKRMSLAKKESFVVSRPTSPSPGTKNMRVAAMDQQEKETTRDVVIPANATPLSLTHKKTLRDHLPTSLRTLARRCSSRLSNGRPKSFAGSRPDPEVEYSLTRRSMGSRPIHSSVGGHMCDFKPLQVGPETSEFQKQSSQRKAILRSSLSEPVPVHRTVDLFRSSTVRLGTSCNPRMGDRDDAQPTEAAKMLTHKKSMRLANGRGLAFTTKMCVDPQVEDDHCSDMQDRSEQGQPVLLETLTSVSDAIPDLDTQESMRREIVSILSRGRKNQQRRQSARSKSPTPLVSATSSVQRLSPLAVEAQEDFPCDESEDDDDEDEEEEEEDEKDTTIEFEKRLIDTCEHIAFMLVPKSRYEFQPLVAL